MPGTHLGLAIIGPSGSGKSTAAGAFVARFRELGLDVGVYKLAAPLYRLQEQFYAVARRDVEPGAQNQVLLETIATHLRAISPTALVDDFKVRLEGASEDVIVNDDLRDDETDWPVLRDMGFRIVRIVAPQAVRLARLAGRSDPTIVAESALDRQIARIPADYVLNNAADGCEELQEQVALLVDELIANASSRVAHAEGSRRIRLTTGNVDIDLDFDARIEAAVAELADHLRLRLVFDLEGAPDFALTLRPFDELRLDDIDWQTEPFALRRSSALPFNLTVRIGRDGAGRTVAVDRENRTGYVCDPSAGDLVMHVDDRSLFHLLETVRYTAIAHEQSRGAAILHAGAVAGPRGAVLVMGHKGSGKTSALLSLLTKYGLPYLSGDKVLVDHVDGRLRLRGWPDYPHIGLGTLRNFPRIADACRIALAGADDDKVLVPFAALAKSFPGGTVDAAKNCASVILPDVTSAERRIAEIRHEAEKLAVLEELIEDARSFTPGMWHGCAPSLAPPDAREVLELLGAARWYRASGRDLDYTSLL